MQLPGSIGLALLGKLGSCEPGVSAHKYQQDEVCIRDSRDADRGVGVIAGRQHNSGKPWEKGKCNSCMQTEEQLRKGRLNFCIPSCRNPALKGPCRAGACGWFKRTLKIATENESCIDVIM